MGPRKERVSLHNQVSQTEAGPEQTQRLVREEADTRVLDSGLSFFKSPELDSVCGSYAFN